MKFGELVPQSKIQDQLRHLNFLTDTLQLSKAYSDANEDAVDSLYRVPTIGVDHLINTWLRQQQAYRQQFVTDMFILAMTVEEIRAPIQHIIGEVFRRGIQWKPKFAVKCQDCLTEYNETAKICETCSSEHLVTPDEAQKKQLIGFLADCNVFDQSLEDVLRETHFDLNCVDDAFIYLGKEYIVGIENEIRSRVVEIRKLNPALVELELDAKGLPKNFHWFCYIHRDLSVTTESGDCDQCGRSKVPAMYKYNNRGSVLYLTDSEIIHLQKFWPHETYGWSPIMTIFDKALTLFGMDKNLYRYFFERKLPSGIIMVFTDDADALRRERENMAVQMKKDPNYLPMVAVSSATNRGRVDFVKLYHTLQEMDYLPVRQEIRERIAAMWGVTPAWQGAPEAYGGLSTQTSQLTVMSRVVETDQRLYHTKVFPAILEAFGVTDWELELPSPEEKAEVVRLQFAQQRIAMASMLFQMGFDIKIKSPDVGLDSIDFVVSGEPKKPQDALSGLFSGMGRRGGGQQQAAQENGEEEQRPMQENRGEEPWLTRANGGGLQTENNSLNHENARGTWLQEIEKQGYIAPLVKEIQSDGAKMLFESDGKLYLADFSLENSKPRITEYVSRTRPQLPNNRHKLFAQRDIPLHDEDEEEVEY